MNISALALPAGVNENEYTPNNKRSNITGSMTHLYKQYAKRLLMQVFTRHGLNHRQLMAAYDKGLAIHQDLAGVHANFSVLDQLNSKQWCSLAVFMVLDEDQNRCVRSRAFVAKLIESFFNAGGKFTARQATMIGKKVKPWGQKNRNLEHYVCSRVPDEPYQVN